VKGQTVFTVGRLIRFQLPDYWAIKSPGRPSKTIQASVRTSGRQSRTSSLDVLKLWNRSDLRLQRLISKCDVSDEPREDRAEHRPVDHY
jgi:hypothetical protein